MDIFNNYNQIKKIIRRLIVANVRNTSKQPQQTRQSPVQDTDDRLLLDLDEHEKMYLSGLDGYTMTSLERQVTFLRAINYIIKNNIAGDIVECGVWKGGNMMLASRILQSYSDTDRKLWLYDTFEGMPQPREDKDFAYDGVSASEYLNQHLNIQKSSNIWAISSFEEVCNNVYSTGIAQDRVILVKGLVEETIPKYVPQKISILRLDQKLYKLD